MSLITENDPVTERLIIEILLNNLIYVYLLIAIIKRYLKNKDIADIRHKKPVQSLKNKMFIISVWITVDLMIILFSFLYDNYWLSPFKYLSLFYIFQMIVLIVQVRMMNFEFLKKIPYAWYIHHLSWLLLTFFHLFFIINTIISQTQILNSLLSNLIIDVLRIFCSGSLVLYSFFWKFQDLTSDIDYLIPIENKFLIHNNTNQFVIEVNKPNVRQSDEMIKKQNELKLKIEIPNKIVNHNGQSCFLIKIDVENQNKYKIHKNVQDFLNLDQKIQECAKSLLLKEGSPPLPKLNINQNEINLRSSLNTDNFLYYRGIFESYLKIFVENLLFPNPLIDFFEIEEPYKTKCIQLFHKKFLLNTINNNDEEYKEENDRSLSVSSVTNLNKDNNNQPNSLFISKKECVYFNVKIKNWEKIPKGNYIIFSFEISLVEKPEEIWIVNKRYSDFVRLNSELRKNLKINLPELPEKKLLGLDTVFLKTRGKKLAKFLRTLLNEKAYFENNMILYEFISLSNENYSILINTNSNNVDYQNLNAQFIDHTILIDDEDQVPYAAYIIQINQLKSDFIYKITKRFSDFERLHKALTIRFKKENNFPAFPSKIPSISQEETLNYRKNTLEKYLNKLFKVPNIEDSLAFRKFLGVIPQENLIKTVEDLAILNSQQLEEY